MRSSLWFAMTPSPKRLRTAGFGSASPCAAGRGGNAASWSAGSSCAREAAPESTVDEAAAAAAARYWQLGSAGGVGTLRGRADPGSLRMMAGHDYSDYNFEHARYLPQQWDRREPGKCRVLFPAQRYAGTGCGAYGAHSVDVVAMVPWSAIPWSWFEEVD